MNGDNNKLIAEFMGMKYSDERSFNDGKWTHSIRSLGKFRTSWDWLMPVVQKIEQDCEGVPQEMINISLYSDINEVYKSVLTFIKNSQHEWR